MTDLYKAKKRIDKALESIGCVATDLTYQDGTFTLEYISPMGKLTVTLTEPEKGNDN